MRLAAALDFLRLGALVDRAATRVPARGPQWTDRPEGDPGVVLLELLSFLAEAIGGRERKRRRRVALAIGALGVVSSALVLAWSRMRREGDA